MCKYKIALQSRDAVQYVSYNLKISTILEILNLLFLSDLPGINFIIIAKREEIKDVRSLDEEEAWKVKTKVLFITCRLFSCC